jgi:hypothetical protein
MKSRRLLLSPLVMVAAGLLLGLCLGVGLGAGLLLMVSGEPRAFDAPPVAADYAIEAVVEEAYINRIMVDSASGMSDVYALTAGELDLRPGGVGDFRVRIEIGPLRPVVLGRVGFRPSANGNSIEVVLLDVRVGQLQLVRLLPEGILKGANADIERLLMDRIGAHGLKVIGLHTDEATLRLQFGRE